MPWFSSSTPSTAERVVAVLSYLSSGLAGIIYVIATGNRSQSMFFRFHFLQSIMTGIFGFLLQWCAGLMLSISTGIASALIFLGPAMSVVVGNTLILIIGLISKAAWLLVLYCAFMAALAKYAEVPFISDMVRRNM